MIEEESDANIEQINRSYETDLCMTKGTMFIGGNVHVVLFHGKINLLWRAER